MIPNRRRRNRGGSSNRGGRGRKNVILQKRSQRLIAANIASTSSGNNKDPLHEEFLEKENLAKGNNSSYANVVIAEDDEESSSYEQNSQKEIILLLENNDIVRFMDANSNPWILMNRYLDTASYAACSYKSRNFYENILKVTESCEIHHYYSNNPQIYSFSKVVIKKIISPHEWGLSTMKEREYLHPEQRVLVNFNYWDYIESFNKAFLYENPKKKHSWLFKVCPKVYNHSTPNWFRKWWTYYGPSIKILPEPFKGLYTEWMEISPKIIDSACKNQHWEGIYSLHFFIKFSIPWIWKWAPEVDYTQQNIPCLKRIFYTKFWPKMLHINLKTGELNSKDTIDLLHRKIAKYKRANCSSPFQQIVNKLKFQTGGEISNAQIMKSYLAEMKKDLIKNMDSQLKQKSDVSMTSSGDENQFTCLAGEYQDHAELSFEDIFHELRYFR